MLISFWTKGFLSSIQDDESLKLRALAVPLILDEMRLNSISLLYNSLERMSTVNVHSSGMTLCCVPACMMVVVIFTGPKSGDDFSVFGRECIVLISSIAKSIALMPSLRAACPARP